MGLVGAHIKEPYRIITRYCPGKSLFDRLHRSSQQLTSNQLTIIAYQVAEGMRFLHEHGIVHRDLKTMNILLDKNDAAEIADFGLAGMSKDNESFIGGVGTPHYTAPEVLERKRYGLKVDVYSYGMILWEMAMRKIPFRHQNHQEIYTFVVTQNYRLPVNDSVPDKMKHLIQKCLNQNPNERPEFKEIVDMFKKGELFFQGSENINVDTLDIPEGCPPLDFVHLRHVLFDPNSCYFESIVDFLELHIDQSMKDYLHQKNIISNYLPGTNNDRSILLIASNILVENEFENFIQNVADPIIQEIMQSLNENNNRTINNLIAAAKFCLRVPNKYFDMVYKYVTMFVPFLNNPQLTPYVLNLLSRLNTDDINSL